MENYQLIQDKKDFIRRILEKQYPDKAEFERLMSNITPARVYLVSHGITSNYPVSALKIVMSIEPADKHTI